MLSFYGHLDPPSVTLRTGDCVKRGQQVGKIGRPNTPPHLHFEIRTHMPNEPGGGYWWEDPTRAGWLPPSQTIWQERMRNAPGVDWLRAPAEQESGVIGLQDKQTLLILEDEQIIGLDLATGEQRWSSVLELHPEIAVLDALHPVLYVGDQLGRVQALRLPNATTTTNESEGVGSTEIIEGSEAGWLVDLDIVGMQQMIPLPQGGIMTVSWNDAVGLSSEGTILWQRETFDRLRDWVQLGDKLLVSTVGQDRSLWTIDESGPQLWPDLAGGMLVGQGDDVLLFNEHGLFSLDVADGTHTLLSDWPKNSYGNGDILDLDGRGFLVANNGSRSRRLVRFDSEGTIVWQRALPDEIVGTPRLLAVAGQPYLITTGDAGGFGALSVYAIDLDHANLLHLFQGGTRSPRPNLFDAYESVDSKVFLSIGGGHLVCLDLEAAAISLGASPDSILH
jgi:hypothetical protein